jgi:hypothetical protein
LGWPNTHQCTSQKKLIRFYWLDEALIFIYFLCSHFFIASPIPINLFPIFIFIYLFIYNIFFFSFFSLFLILFSFFLPLSFSLLFFFFSSLLFFLSFFFKFPFYFFIISPCFFFSFIHCVGTFSLEQKKGFWKMFVFGTLVWSKKRV